MIDSREGPPSQVAKRYPQPLIGPLINKKHPPETRPLPLLTTPSVGIIEATVEALVVAPERALRLQQLVLLVQEVQAVVARQTSDGELVGHFGPLLPIGCDSLVQLSRPRKQLRQQPDGQDGVSISYTER